MKLKVITSSIIALFCLQMANAQVISDSVTLGPGYTNQVFYKLSNGTKTTATNQDWDLQFFSSLFSASIRINNGVGVELYSPASQDTSNFTSSTLDTAAMTIMRDGYVTWETDAITSQQTGHPDYGWGKYKGLGNIVGYRVFVIKLSGGAYKKIWIREFKTSGEVIFSVADLNGGNLFNKTFNRNTYSTKRHFYFDIENDSILDVEPTKTDWELVFRTYNDVAGPQYYNVTGALSNQGLAIAQVNNTAITTAQANWNLHTYDSSINVIGYDWKNFNRVTNTWDITDSLSYIMKDYNGDVYQLVFTGTTGASSGKMYFTKELFSAVSIEENSPVVNLGVYPNPTQGVLNINFELANSAASTQIKLVDIKGRTVKQIAEDFVGRGFNRAQVDITNLPTGIYFLTIQSGDSVITKRVVKN